MSERRIGVIINGATGRMGTMQHMAGLLAITAEGGLRPPQRRPPDPGAAAGRPRRRAAASVGGGTRQPTLDHQPDRGFGWP
jgi:hypothetical protein